MIRRAIVGALLLALPVTSVGAYWQSQRSNDSSQPEWAAHEGPTRRALSTPMLSVRRAPQWLAAPVEEARLVNAVNAAITDPRTPPDTCLVAYRNDEIVAGHRLDALLVPASLMKLLTATAIVEQAGADARFSTEVVAERGAWESVAGGVLSGDLYLVGGGDPVLSTPEYFERYEQPVAHTDITELAEVVAAALGDRGITTISGSVMGDESRYPETERDYSDQLPRQGSDPIWKASYVANNQVGPLSALTVNDGYAEFSSFTGAANRRQNVRADNPALLAAEIFTDLLEARGVEVTEGAGVAVSPAWNVRHALGSVQSPPVSEIVERMLRESDNTTAEMLFKEVGRIAEIGSARALAFFVVFEIVQRVLDLPAEVTNGVIVADGSGLSTYNRVTCRMVAELLRRAGPQSPLVDGLATAGQSGTLRNCEAQTPDGLPAEVEVKAKTGTLNDVTALAGVTVAENADVLTFAMIANGDNLIAELGTCNVLQQALMSAITGHPYGPSGDDPSLAPRPPLVAQEPAVDAAATQAG